MKVICAGFMKTGTKSLAKALRILHYTVYDVEEHMSIHLQPWLEIFEEGREPDFFSMYQDVDAVTDMPANAFYQEILEAFPDAKVILSERDSEDIWVQSWIKHMILRLTMERELMRPLIYVLSSTFRKIPQIRKHPLPFLLGISGIGAEESKFLMKKKYREHNERVKAIVPPDRLLVYNVKQGWEPLCKFLECESPSCSFPQENVAGSTTRKIFSVQSILRFDVVGPKIAREIVINLLFIILVISFILALIAI